MPSKICTVTKKHKGTIKQYTQIGTGNYNEKTARLYVDYCYLTSNQEIGDDATEFFKNLALANLQGHYNKFLVAPTSLRSGIMNLIDKMKKDVSCDLTQCIQMWDFLYLDDAVKAIINLCEQECTSGAYNLGSGDVRKLKAYVEEVKKILHSSSQINYGAVPYPETGMVSIVPSINKIKKEISWEPRVSFEELSLIHI